MYRNPAQSLAEFVNFYHANKTNPQEQNKSFYRLTTPSGTEIDLPFSRVKHIEQKHRFSTEQWQALEQGMEQTEYAYYIPGMKGENDGVQLFLKINTFAGKAGVVLETLPNGRVLLDTAFFDTDANIDNWAKNEPLQRPSRKKPVLVGSGITDSLADIIQKIKAQKPDVYYQEDNAFFIPQETEKTTFKNELNESVNGNLPAKKMLAVGHTPRLYVELGLPDLPLALPQNVVRKVSRDKHQVDVKTVERLPELIYDPVAVFQSMTEENSLVALTSAKDKNGNPVIVVLKPTEHKINVIPSLYGKDNFNNFVRKNILQETVLYVDKEQAVRTIRKQELQLLRWDSPDGLIHSIRTKEDFVNPFPDDSVYFQGRPPHATIMRSLRWFIHPTYLCHY